MSHLHVFPKKSTGELDVAKSLFHNTDIGFHKEGAIAFTVYDRADIPIIEDLISNFGYMEVDQRVECRDGVVEIVVVKGEKK